HQNSIAQFTSGAGEAAKNQNSLFVVPRGDKLLRHQVHPVVEGGHQAEIGRLVVALDLLVAVVPLQEDDWLPSARLEAPVDPFGLGFHVGKQVVIALDMRTAGGANLYKGKLALISRVFLERSE